MAKHQKISLMGGQAHRLSAIVTEPESQEISAYALLIHCFGGHKEFATMRVLADELAQRGIASLRFDFTGLGESEGVFAETQISSQINDIVAAYNYMRATYMTPTVLVGHSLGGTTGILAAHQMDAVRLVVTIGAPYSLELLTGIFRDALQQASEKGWSEIRVGRARYVLFYDFWHDLARHDLQLAVRELRRQLIVVHGQDDDVVSFANAERIYQAAQQPKQIMPLYTREHVLSEISDLSLIAATISSTMAGW